jgi:hypothetical protein
MPGWYYHYIDDPAEVTQIKDDRRIQSMQPSANPLTWYTPTVKPKSARPVAR